MTYKELQKIAEDNGYEMKIEIDHVLLTKYEEDNIIKISTIKEDIIFSTMYACMPRDFQMLKASLELSETLLEDRYPEKKYYLRHKFLNDICGECFLNHDLVSDDWRLNNKTCSIGYKTQFTMGEIEEIKEKYETNLSDFNIEEVKNEII